MVRYNLKHTFFRLYVDLLYLAKLFENSTSFSSFLKKKPFPCLCIILSQINIYRMANRLDPEQTAPFGAVCFGSKLLASDCCSNILVKFGM